MINIKRKLRIIDFRCITGQYHMRDCLEMSLRLSWTYRVL